MPFMWSTCAICSGGASDEIDDGGGGPVAIVSISRTAPPARSGLPCLSNASNPTPKGVPAR
eukprot:1674957-Prymnesium_polylepis.1